MNYTCVNTEEFYSKITSYLGFLFITQRRQIDELGVPAFTKNKELSSRANQHSWSCVPSLDIKDQIVNKHYYFEVLV